VGNIKVGDCASREKKATASVFYANDAAKTGITRRFYPIA
jgi:hypothetical protein